MSSINTIWKNSFILFSALSLLFHVFNTLQATATIKVFHLFAVAAVITGSQIIHNKSVINQVFTAFVIWTVISCLLSPVSVSFLSGVKFVVIVLSAFFIIRVPILQLTELINCVVPIILLVLLFHYLGERPIYRYQGFYDDPNYMCTTLLTLLFFILLLWKHSKSLILRIGLILEVLIIVFLITTTISRTGILCLALILMGFFWDILKKSGIKGIIGIVLFVGLIIYFRPDLINQAISGYVLRETQNVDTITNASGFRWEISMRGINYITYHPRFFFQGIGIGSYTSAYELPGWSAPTTHIDHNTFTSCFSEQGFIGLLLYLWFLVLIFKNLLTNSTLEDTGMRRICVVVLLSILLFSVSINQMVYLPYWILIMSLANISLSTSNDLVRE